MAGGRFTAEESAPRPGLPVAGRFGGGAVSGGAAEVAGVRGGCGPWWSWF